MGVLEHDAGWGVGGCAGAAGVGCENGAPRLQPGRRPVEDGHRALQPRWGTCSRKIGVEARPLRRRLDGLRAGSPRIVLNLISRFWARRVARLVAWWVTAGDGAFLFCCVGLGTLGF